MNISEILSGYSLQTKISLFHILYPRLSLFEQREWVENFAVEFTHYSTAIEGNRISLLGTKMILEDEIVPEETTLRELNEVLSHKKAWDYVKESAVAGIPLTEKFIQAIHERVVPIPGIGGPYRTGQTYIRGTMYIPPSATQVRKSMETFIETYQKMTEAEPLEKAVFVQAELAKILPFGNGNGRVARLAMNYSLLSDGYPPIAIKDNMRKVYFEYLKAYEMEGCIQPLQRLIAQILATELDDFFIMHMEKLQL